MKLLASYSLDQRAYVGFQTEDPSIGFWVMGTSGLHRDDRIVIRQLSAEWASMTAMQTYHQSEGFKTIQAASQPVFAGTPTKTFVQFPSTGGIFSAPVTEFVTFTLKKGVTMDKLRPLVTQLQDKLQGTPKFYGSSWAPVVDTSSVYHGVLGWESVQVS